MARGDYIAVLEGDDYWPAHKLDAQLPSFDMDDIVLSWGMFSFDLGGVVTEADENIYRPLPNCKSMTHSLLIKNHIPAVTVMIRKKPLVQLGGFYQPEGTLSVDISTWARLSLIGTFRFVPEMLGIWRQHPNQTTQRNRGEMAAARIIMIEDFIAHLPKDQEDRIVKSHCLGHIAFCKGIIADTEGRPSDALRHYTRALLLQHKDIKLPTLKVMLKLFVRGTLVGISYP
jgi:hypothetical protein